MISSCSHPAPVTLCGVGPGADAGPDEIGKDDERPPLVDGAPCKRGPGVVAPPEEEGGNAAATVCDEVS